MKFFSRLLVTVLLAVVFTLPFADISFAQVPRSNWSQTCYGPDVSEGLLFAECQRADGSWNHQTEINTDDFIGNINGILMSAESMGDVPRRNWSQTCEDAAISDDGVLSAVCQRMDGSWDMTDIDTDEFIGNINGVLMTDL